MYMTRPKRILARKQRRKRWEEEGVASTLASKACKIYQMLHPQRFQKCSARDGRCCLWVLSFHAQKYSYLPQVINLQNRSLKSGYCQKMASRQAPRDCHATAGRPPDLAHFRPSKTKAVIVSMYNAHPPSSCKEYSDKLILHLIFKCWTKKNISEVVTSWRI